MLFVRAISLFVWLYILRYLKSLLTPFMFRRASHLIGSSAVHCSEVPPSSMTLPPTTLPPTTSAELLLPGPDSGCDELADDGWEGRVVWWAVMTSLSSVILLAWLCMCVKANQGRLRPVEDSGESLAQDRTPRVHARSGLPDGWHQATEGLV